MQSSNWRWMVKSLSCMFASVCFYIHYVRTSNEHQRAFFDNIKRRYLFTWPSLAVFIYVSFSPILWEGKTYLGWSSSWCFLGRINDLILGSTNSFRSWQNREKIRFAMFSLNQSKVSSIPETYFWSWLSFKTRPW